MLDAKLSACPLQIRFTYIFFYIGMINGNFVQQNWSKVQIMLAMLFWEINESMLARKGALKKLLG